MDFSEFKLVRLQPDHVIKPFDCGDQDLNEFLHKDSVNHLSSLLAVTYLLESKEETCAFFSLLNDKITITDMESNRGWKRKVRDLMPKGKRYTSYPSMKIGRLGVSCNYQGKGIGTMILDYLKELFINNNRTGCRYITVDAYNQSLKFYADNDFDFLTEKDVRKDTRIMYFDLYQD